MTVENPEEERQLYVSFKGATRQLLIAVGDLPRRSALLMRFSLSSMHRVQTQP